MLQQYPVCKDGSFASLETAATNAVLTFAVRAGTSVSVPWSHHSSTSDSAYEGATRPAVSLLRRALRTASSLSRTTETVHACNTSIRLTAKIVKLWLSETLASKICKAPLLKVTKLDCSIRKQNTATQENTRQTLTVKSTGSVPGLASTFPGDATTTFLQVPTQQDITPAGGCLQHNVVSSRLLHPREILASASSAFGRISRALWNKPMSNDEHDSNRLSRDIHRRATSDSSPLTAFITSSGVISETDEATSDPTLSTIDALSVLLAALPSQAAASIESEYQLVTTASSSALTSTRPSVTTTPSTTPLSSTTTISVVPLTPSSRSSQSTPSISSTSPSTLLTSTRSSSSASTTTGSGPVTTNAPPTTQNEPSGGAIAGIATGVTAGFVLLMMGIIFLVRRRKHRGALFGRRASQRSQASDRAYPEVAWLYDPSPSPPRSPHRIDRLQTQAAMLRPEATHDDSGAYGRQPDMVESPLLPPEMPPVLRNGPSSGSPSSSPRTSYGSARGSPHRSGNSSDGSRGEGRRRPLHAIYESYHAQ